MSYITSIIKGSKEEPICAKGSEEEPICATSQADFLFDFFNINPLDYDEDIYVSLNKTKIEEILRKFETNEFGIEDAKMLSRLKKIFKYFHDFTDFEKERLVIEFEIIPCSVIKEWREEVKLDTPYTC